MTESENSTRPTCDHSVDKICEFILVEQRATWGTDEFQSSEAWLDAYPVLRDDSELMVDVIYNEFLLCHESGGNAEPKSFLQRFPSVSDELKQQFQLWECLDSDLSKPESGGSPLELLGDEIDGRIQLLELIGHGGAATVYRAFDRQLSREVACKIAREPLMETSRMYKRFIREAESAAGLDHPGIVPVFGMGHFRGHPYIITQLMKEALEDHLDDELSTQTIVGWMIDVADAASFAHQCGVVHRDLKPGNILFDREMRPRLADFGLAGLLDFESSLTRHGDVLGTPAYMSPEQARGDHWVSPASDIYSLGVILYQLICGHRPFGGPADVVLQQVREVDPIPPKNRRSSVPRDLETICLKAMRKQAEDRYASAGELAEDLKRYRDGHAISAKRESIAQRLARLSRRHPAASILALIVTMLTLFVLGGAIQYAGVVKENRRATAAEAEAEALLTRESITAAILEQRQGRTRAATRRFQEVLKRECDRPGDLHLRIVDCEIINGRFESAANHLRHAEKLVSPSVPDPAVTLRRVVLAHRQGTIDDDTMRLMRQLIESDDPRLTQANRFLLQGFLAKDSLSAFDLFQKGVGADPGNFSCRLMATLTALSLADLQEVARLTGETDFLFPDNDEFIYLKAIAASVGDLKQASRVLEQIPAKRRDEAWREFLVFLNKKCNQLSAGGTGVFLHQTQSESRPLSYSGLLELLHAFRSRYSRLFVDRGLRPIPAIQAQFQNLPGADKLQLSFTSDEPLLRLAEVHQERTLATVIASYLYDRSEKLVARLLFGKPNTEFLKRLQATYETAIDSKGFLRDGRRSALLGAFALSAFFYTKGIEPDQNLARSLELIAQIDPEWVAEIDSLRVMTLYATNHSDWPTADRFVRHWITAAKAESHDQHLRTATWAFALVLEQQQRWAEVARVTGEMIEQFGTRPADWDPAVRPSSLRTHAIGQLMKQIGLADDQMSWDKLFFAAVAVEDWDTARSAAERWEAQSDSDERRQLVATYQNLVTLAQNGRGKDVLDVISQLESLVDELPEPIKRIRNQLIQH